ncbi:hypothetical protein AAK873_07000, partial [Heminiphilus faecis]
YGVKIKLFSGVKRTLLPGVNQPRLFHMLDGNNRIEESSLINEQSSSNNFIADHVIIGGRVFS